MLLLSSSLAMPRTKSNRQQRNQQNPVRHSAQPLTRESSRSTAGPTPCTGTNTQPQPDPLTDGTLTKLLDLIRNQVRAKPNKRPGSYINSSTTVTDTTGQQATTGQAAATTSQSDPTVAGMLICANIKYSIVS